MASYILLLSVLLSGGGTGYPSCLSTEEGFSGYPMLPTADVLAIGQLRIRSGLSYCELESGPQLLKIPGAVSWGFVEDLELSAGIPLFLDDDGMEGGLIGNITGGVSYLFETARGGTGLVLRALAEVPTGSDQRDGKGRLMVGGTTSTTFRRFRMSGSAFYGATDPFGDDSEETMSFSAGGSSFITHSLQLVAVMRGNTAGSIDLGGTISFHPVNQVGVYVSLRSGLEGPVRYCVQSGVSWIGSGF
ncbi:hypothetical protein GF402_03340 [Candidatus Fermentibacteria bacterium]|nr:hypothetical protein [Candidatus Fermentibacteria bacterium]